MPTEVKYSVHMDLRIIETSTKKEEINVPSMVRGEGIGKGGPSVFETYVGMWGLYTEISTHDPNRRL